MAKADVAEYEKRTGKALLTRELAKACYMIISLDDAPVPPFNLRMMKNRSKPCLNGSVRVYDEAEVTGEGVSGVQQADGQVSP